MILFSINKVPEKNQKNKKSASLKIGRKVKVVFSVENQHKKLEIKKGRSRKQKKLKTQKSKKYRKSKNIFKNSLID